MKADSINKLIIGTIVLSIIADALALLTELLNRKREKAEEREQKVKEDTVSQALLELCARIEHLEKSLVKKD